METGRQGMQGTYALTPEALAALRGHSVAVEPWEIAAAWAYDLDWRPLPIFQNYSAYTSELDRLNAAAIEDPNGPEVLLRQIPAGAGPLGGRAGFMGRQPAWDPPEQNIATVCNFIPVLTEGTWQVLSRIPDRCGPEKLIASLRKKVAHLVAAEHVAAAPPAADRAELKSDAVDLLRVMDVSRAEAAKGVEAILDSEPALVTVQDVVTEFFRRRQEAR